MMAETFHGYIETTQDVLLIFEGCRRGLLPRICRRLQERERKLIRSGSIFVFDERESGTKRKGNLLEKEFLSYILSYVGIKRWTDGRVWSPSRILGNFLIYRELDKKIPGDKKLSSSSVISGRSFSLDGSIDRQKEKQLIGSLSDSYKFKEDGLIKKTMSITVNGVAQHLISYYNPREVLENRLRLPSSVPELASLEISPELLVKQNFRVPPLVEPIFDQNDPELSSRHYHAYRSMSAGSIRGQEHPHVDQLVRNEHLPVYPIPRLDMDNRSPNINLYGQNQNFSSNISPNVTPSPSTPMIPQPRQSYHHHRHYSTSSTNSFNRPDLQNDGAFQDRHLPPHTSFGHPHVLPDIAANNNNDNSGGNETNINTTTTTATTNDNNSNNDIYNQQSAIDNNASRHNNNERLATPNLVQLLNPIHPLHNNDNTLQPMEYNYPSFNTNDKEANTLQPLEYNYHSFNNNTSDKQQDNHHRESVVNYMQYQSQHPLHSSVDNFGFISNQPPFSNQQGQQDQNSIGSLINGLK
jgi:hypothetical protein